MKHLGMILSKILHLLWMRNLAATKAYEPPERRNEVFSCLPSSQQNEIPTLQKHVSGTKQEQQHQESKSPLQSGTIIAPAVFGT